MANIAVNLVVLRSPDIERARRFYEAAGLVFQLEQHGKGPEHHATTIGGLTLEIYPASSDDSGMEKTRIGLLVPSIDKAVTDMVKCGGRLLTPPKDSPWGRRAVLADPDDRRVELTETESNS